MSLFLCLAAVAIDGDTLRCANLRDEANGRVRIARIAAPETGEAGGAEAKAALAAMIAGRDVRCELVDANPRTAAFEARDPFGRPVARCEAGGVDLGARLVEQGLAGRWP